MNDYLTESFRKSPSKESQIILESLQKAVSDALDKKRRLGQYAVIWKNGAPFMTNEEGHNSTNQQ